MTTSALRVSQRWLLRQGSKVHVLVRDLPEPLQRALKEVRYNKLDIGIQSASQVAPTEGSAAFDGNRGYIVVVDLASGHYKVHLGAWGGASAFDQRQVDLDQRPQSIPHNGAVIVGEYGGRGSFAHIKVNPSNLQGILPRPAEEIDDREAKALSTILGLKSGYRADEFRRHGLGEYAPGNPLIRSLAAKKFLKLDSRGGISVTIEGKNALHSR
jgi:hypothetical protein